MRTRSSRVIQLIHWWPLPKIAPSAEAHGQRHHRQRAAGCGRARCRCAGTRRGCRVGGARRPLLPTRCRDRRRSPCPAGLRFVEHVVAAIAVEADGRGADRAPSVCGRASPSMRRARRSRSTRERQISRAAAARPRQAEDRRAGEIDDGVDVRFGRQRRQAFRRRWTRSPKSARACRASRLRTKTRSPRAIRRSTSALPMKPVAPVTRTVRPLGGTTAACMAVRCVEERADGESRCARRTRGRRAPRA